MHTLRNDLREEAVLRREVWQLPQTGVEAVVRELFEHLHGILEAILGKLIVALPIDTKPTGIEVDHIAGNLVSTQLTSNLKTLLLREVGDAAHPGAEAPERQHG